MNQKKNAPKEKKIPTAKMQEGIKLSLKKSIEHLDGAEALINKNLLNDSVALIQFAIEEFGRAVILRNMLRDGLETVERNLWYNHDHKYDTAFTVLPKDLQTIWESMVPITGIRATAYATAASSAVATAYVRPSRRSVLIRVEKETISHDTRLNAIFIDFNETTQKWESGIKANRTRLEVIIGKMRESIKFFKV